ncbi:TPA: hypothetical protein DCF80_02160 [Candidatus Saccharibacteria bacterium]|nr:hypothetical protein [Candidatus Saccharibacteria bacterium]HRK40530.1 hypothetical protein [Candidatus Saccharibacteria bacterium]
MAIFGHKKTTPKDEAADQISQVFDEEFREEMRAQGRLYFERVINENATLFKQDLDATVAHVNTELKQHMARQLDEQFAEIARSNATLRDHITKNLNEKFAEYGKTVEDAQNKALQALSVSTQTLQAQHQQLSASIQKTVADQEATLAAVAKKNEDRIRAMEEAQSAALQTLAASVQALQTQYHQLGELLQKGVVEQQAMLIGAFEKNMAIIVEHYVTAALGDQFDMKAQLPGIIQQMEANKQAIVDDMKL